ncbi:PBSX family phage terminase large subunit [Streptococcus equi subsp. equi]|uniref:PBSX family phage terminase large subunit n=3 Tax=Streptococcus equi TaxID=1336 RepID=UPI00067E6216|nr:PBSX family phage terminase large subunit [Streptococcus equi]MBT1194665.1 PBSX family phage terminase large subunit [Streptococcus equi subsp. equi]MBT1197495.1 PBSX family phage terminase large subunit [Streptococcus equi subsp. equi]MBT1199703.1 PBSX family phage terminase large subunit [Streptococcus equi subsp. equi]MBT1202285.1 PBSX family phage terminase large subunit [Streptococcus equi subsp. equi]MBT1203599.1 PBSX family phage terminase large subunit [Streptococcus equi subsp. equ
MCRVQLLGVSTVFNKHIYDKLYDYDTFTEVHYGGASSGKSHGVIQKVVLKACQDWKHPRKVLFLRKVGATVYDSIFEDVKQCLELWGLLDKCKVNNSAYRIELPNGATFIFKGLDNPEKIKSIKGVSDVVMEEASEFTLDDYTQLTLRLRDRKHLKKQIFLMFNPVSKVNWVYKAFFVKTPKNTVVYQTTYKDNRFLDDVTRENIEELANRNEAYYKIYALGQFATLDKLIFPKYEKKILNKDKLSHLPSFFGLDYGFINDPSAFLHVKIDDNNKKLYILEEYVRKNLTNDKIANAIKDLGYAKEEIRGDSAEKKSNQELRNLGIPRIIDVKKGPGSVMQGIQYLLQYDWIVDERCVKTIEELENYTWKKDKKTNEYINDPVDSYNHCIDAIRYATSNHFLTLDKKQSNSFNIFRKAGFGL